MVIGGWKEATRKADIEKAIREIINHLDLKPIGDVQVPGKRATIAFIQFASKAEMWESAMKVKNANLKLPETGESIWASQSKSREDRIRGKKFQRLEAHKTIRRKPQLWAAGGRA